MRKIGLLFLGAVVLAVAAGIVLAATGATISFLDSTDQPEYQVAAATVVDDDGCDIVTMMMLDATGGITDVDTLCLDLVTGIGTNWTDWGSHQSGYIPIVSPVTYAVFDTYLNDACYTDENSYACSDYLLSGTVTCLAETFHEVIDVPVRCQPSLESGLERPTAFVAPRRRWACVRFPSPRTASSATCRSKRSCSTAPARPARV
ncbi:MAG: hypothetical protein IPK19_13825 [Chloroflexi bacterium]|nr:hypothetical protein [Chloroflexota bacterium]